MKIILQRHAILLAALLQVLPVVRNFFVSPPGGSAFAFILRWGIGAAATVGAMDAVSGATIASFTSPSSFTGTVGVPFTNNITLDNTKSQSGSLAVITSNSISAILSTPGQSTNFAMPPGLVLQFAEDVNLPSPVYDAMYGTPTTPGTNTFIISMEYSSVIISTNITIVIFPAGTSTPAITNQSGSTTNLVGGNPTFSVTAGPQPLNYQWFFNTNTPLSNANNSILTLTNVQLAQAGYYSVVISNSLGTVTSTPAQLIVWQSPAIVSQTAGLTNVAGSPARFRVIATAMPPASYQWYFNTNTLLANATNSLLNLTNVHVSQAGSYFAIITNVVGSTTSSPALLVVTLPPTPTLNAVTNSDGTFQFSFNPTIGLTNTVQTTTSLPGDTWKILTNIAPPTTSNAITISDPLTPSNRLYRLQL